MVLGLGERVKILLWVARELMIHVSVSGCCHFHTVGDEPG